MAGFRRAIWGPQSLFATLGQGPEGPDKRRLVSPIGLFPQLHL